MALSITLVDVPYRIAAGLVYVTRAGSKGRGVFASIPIGPSDLIEQCPVIVLPRLQYELVKETILYEYVFRWDATGSVAIALGYGSLYNHSYTPNAEYVRNVAGQCINIVARSVIASDDEITVNYNGNPDDISPVWFAPETTPKG